MKYTDQFISNNFIIDHENIYGRVTAIQFLVNNKVDIPVVNINSIPYTKLSEIGALLKWNKEEIKRAASEIRSVIRTANPTHVPYLKNSQLEKDIHDELLREVRKSQNYFLEFQSYGLSYKVSRKKAISLSMMKVIRYFVIKYKDERTIYNVMKTFPIQSHINCSSAKEFYKYISWLNRIGTFKGVLLGEHQINNKLWKK